MCPLSWLLFMSGLTFLVSSTAYVVTEHHLCFLSSLTRYIMGTKEEKPGNIVVMMCWRVLSGFMGQFKIDTTSSKLKCGIFCRHCSASVCVVEYLKVLRYQTDRTPAIILMNTMSLLVEISADNNQGLK